MAAIVQLEKAANLMNTAAAIASVNGGVAILIQTCGLHPVPALRMHATATLAACTRANDENFAKAAIERRLPEAMVRVLREEDRRIKKAVEESTGGKAHDPDLPTRRLALEGVAAALAPASWPLGSGRGVDTTAAPPLGSECAPPACPSCATGRR